jgi:hypothetical protein
MKFEVVRNNNIVISRHKTRQLAERALQRSMKKELASIDQKNSLYTFIGWDNYTTKKTGIYHIRQV